MADITPHRSRRGDKSLQHIAATIVFVCTVKRQVIALIAAIVAATNRVV